MTPKQYLDRCRKLTKTGSDYAVAKMLGISEDAVNGYRTGKRTMDNRTCRKIAEALSVDPLRVIASVERERARDPTERNAWGLLAETEPGNERRGRRIGDAAHPSRVLSH